MPGIISSINSLRRNTSRYTGWPIELSYSQGITTHRTGNSSDDIQGVDGQENTCPLAAFITNFIRVSIVFFQLRKWSPDSKKQNKQTGTHRQKTRSTSNGHPMPSGSPRKRNQYHYSRVPRRWLLCFPSGVKLLVFFAAVFLVFGFAACLQENGVWWCKRRSNLAVGSSPYSDFSGEKSVSPRVRAHVNEQTAVGSSSSCLPVQGTLLSGYSKTCTSRWWFELIRLRVHLTLVTFHTNTCTDRYFGTSRAGGRG